MINKNIDAVTRDDLQSLIDTKYFERKTIDYKVVLPTNKDKDKREFLADVSSFANSSGGDIVYGMSEKGGTPQKMKGVDIEDIDKEVQRLDNMLRDGIEPRITGYTIKPIPLEDAKYMVIVNVRKSWNNPHRVTFNKDYRFFARNSTGKYPLDVSDLRVAFTLSETIADKVRRFREGRIASVYAEEAPVPLIIPMSTVLHLIPYGAFEPAQSCEIFQAHNSPELLKTIHSPYGGTPRYNFEGVIVCHQNDQGSSTAYTQLYRNGIIEAAEGLLVREGVIYNPEYEQKLIESLDRYLHTFKQLKIAPPVVIFLTLLGLKGYQMKLHGQSRGTKIDRDILIIPEVLIESYDVKPETVLRPCFDTIWNAFGMARSFNYDGNGKWTGGK